VLHMELLLLTQHLDMPQLVQMLLIQQEHKDTKVCYSLYLIINLIIEAKSSIEASYNAGYDFVTEGGRTLATATANTIEELQEAAKTAALVVYNGAIVSGKLVEDYGKKF